MIKQQNWLSKTGQITLGSSIKEFLQVTKKTVNEVLLPFVKNSNIAWFASHKHQGYPTKNLAYKYCYLYKYALELPENATTITLPKNEKIKIFAISVAQNTGVNIQISQPLSDDFKENKPYVFQK